MSHNLSDEQKLLESLRDDKARLTSALEAAEAALAKCGKENCMGRAVDGCRTWVSKERLDMEIYRYEEARLGREKAEDRVKELEAEVSVWMKPNIKRENDLRNALDRLTALTAERDTALSQCAEAVKGLDAVIGLDPAHHSAEGFNEWGEADCFRQAQHRARVARDRVKNIAALPPVSPDKE